MSDGLEPWVTPIAPIFAPRLMLDLISGQRNDEDLVDRLMLDAIILFNLRQVLADPALQMRFAAASAPPPDDVRQPITIAALATQMSMPLETVRRRTQRLAALNLCAITPAGVRVTAEQVSARYDEGHLLTMFATLEAGYLQLKGLGFFDEQPLPRPQVAPGAPLPVRPAVRLAGVFTQRALELAAERVGSTLSVILLGTMARENMMPILPLMGIGKRPPSAPTATLIGMLRPMSVAKLAAAVRMDRETVRRRILRLTRLGYCQRREEGYVVSFAFMRSPAVVSTYAEQEANLRRLYVGCAEAGCLEVWDAAAAPAS